MPQARDIAAVMIPERRPLAQLNKINKMLRIGKIYTNIRINL